MTKGCDMLSPASWMGWLVRAEDPLDGLWAARHARFLLNEWELYQLRRARRNHGEWWEAIALAMGVSIQAARQKYVRRERKLAEHHAWLDDIAAIGYAFEDEPWPPSQMCSLSMCRVHRGPSRPSRGERPPRRPYPVPSAGWQTFRFVRPRAR